MRRFLNAVIEVKQKVPEILPMIYKVMNENQWVEERRLFFMEDINDVKSENRTPHAMLTKAFPELENYWHVSEKSNEQEGKWFGHFSNFPGFMNGQVVFMPEDNAVTRELLAGVGERIPRPCAFYQTAIALDGIRWYEDSNTAPEIDWQELRCYPDGNFMPGEQNTYAFFFGTRFYQSNCILVDKRFDLRPAFIIRIELTEKHPRKEALAIVEKFAKAFGTTEKTYKKIYTISVSPWEEKEQLLNRQEKMQTWYNQWCEKTLSKLKKYGEDRVEFNTKERKTPTIQTLQKRLLKECGLFRHEIRPWDGYGWCKQVRHHFWLYVELVAEPTEPEHYNFEHKLNNYMRIVMEIIFIYMIILI